MLVLLTGFVSRAWAAEGGPPNLPDLGPYPILQLFGGILTLLMIAGGALLWLKGEASKRHQVATAPAETKSPGAVAVITGPLQMAEEFLRKIASMLERLLLLTIDLTSLRTDMEQLKHLSERREEETRNRLRDEIIKQTGSCREHTDRELEKLEGSYKELEERVRRLEINQGPPRRF